MKNKSFFILFFLIVFIATDIYSQFYQEWVTRYNGTGNGDDAGLDIATDVLGNVYITGYAKVGGLNYDIATLKYSAGGGFLWLQTYNGPGTSTSYDEGYSIAVDNTGNVYVTGNSRGNGSGVDYVTIKYSTLGVEQWVQRYNGPANSNDGSFSIAVDNASNVYVTGDSRGSGSGQDYFTIKYNSAGVQQWTARENGTGNADDFAVALVIDNAGNVYVTGRMVGSGTNIDYGTVKYNSQGVKQWLQTYNGQPGLNGDAAHAITVDNLGNVYVTGYSSGIDRDYVTIKYNSAGVQQWAKRYNGTDNSFDEPWAIAVDTSGNVYVTGQSNGSGTNSDYGTIKYNAAGVQQWVARYNTSVNDVDIAYDIALDSSGNIYVTGQSSSVNNTNRDYATVKYNPSGVQQWEARYNGPANHIDHGKAITIGAFRNVYVTGLSRGINSVEDYATLKYIQQPYTPINLSALAVSASRINLNWTDNAGNETGFKIERSTNGGSNWSLINTIGSNITLYADSNLAANTIYHYRVYAYNQSGNSGYSNITFDTTFNPVGITINNSELPKEYSLFQNYPNPFNPTTQIELSIPKSSFVVLKVYDILGKELEVLIKQELSHGVYKVDYDATKYPSGIYFYRLETADFTATKKMIVVK